MFDVIITTTIICHFRLHLVFLQVTFYIQLWHFRPYLNCAFFVCAILGLSFLDVPWSA